VDLQAVWATPHLIVLKQVGSPFLLVEVTNLTLKDFDYLDFVDLVELDQSSPLLC